MRSVSGPTSSSHRQAQAEVRELARQRRDHPRPAPEVTADLIVRLVDQVEVLDVGIAVPIVELREELGSGMRASPSIIGFDQSPRITVIPRLV